MLISCSISRNYRAGPEGTAHITCSFRTVICGGFATHTELSQQPHARVDVARAPVASGHIHVYPYRHRQGMTRMDTHTAIADERSCVHMCGRSWSRFGRGLVEARSGRERSGLWVGPVGRCERTVSVTVRESVGSWVASARMWVLQRPRRRVPNARASSLGSRASIVGVCTHHETSPCASCAIAASCSWSAEDGLGVHLRDLPTRRVKKKTSSEGRGMHGACMVQSVCKSEMASWMPRGGASAN